MTSVYVLDACALLAVIKDEPHTNSIDAAYNEATNNTARLVINRVNLLEVYYVLIYEFGIVTADRLLAEITGPVIEIADLSQKSLVEAGRSRPRTNSLLLTLSHLPKHPLAEGRFSPPTTTRWTRSSNANLA
jgi:predicted nucleic acid-binding protein